MDTLPARTGQLSQSAQAGRAPGAPLYLPLGPPGNLGPLIGSVCPSSELQVAGPTQRRSLEQRVPLDRASDVWEAALKK